LQHKSTKKPIGSDSLHATLSDADVQESAALSFCAI